MPAGPTAAGLGKTMPSRFGADSWLGRLPSPKNSDRPIAAALMIADCNALHGGELLQQLLPYPCGDQSIEHRNHNHAIFRQPFAAFAQGIQKVVDIIERFIKDDNRG